MKKRAIVTARSARDADVFGDGKEGKREREGGGGQGRKNENEDENQGYLPMAMKIARVTIDD